MKTLLILLVLTLIIPGNICLSQNTKIDSLEKALSKVEDYEKVSVLDQLVNECILDNPDKALSYARQSSDIMARINSKKEQFQNKYLIKSTGKTKMDTTAKLNEFQYKMKIWDLSADKLGKANELKNMGKYYLEQGKLLSALDYFFKALSLYEDKNYAIGQIDILLLVNTIYVSEGNYKRALYYVQYALNLAQEIKNKQLIAKANLQFGMTYSKLGKHYDAIVYYIKTFELAKEIDDLSLEVKSLNTIGLEYAELADYNKSQDFLNKSLTLAEEKNDNDGKYTARINLGYLYTIKGEYRKSVQFYKDALTFMESKGDKRSTGVLYNNVAYNYEMEARNTNKNELYNNVKEYYLKAISAYQSAGEVEGTIMAINNLGGTFHDLGEMNKSRQDLQKGLEYFNQALKMAIEIDSKFYINECYKNIGHTYGFLNDYQKAFEFLDLSLPVTDTLIRKESDLKLSNVKKLMELEIDKQEQIITKQKSDFENEVQKLKNSFLNKWFVTIGFLVLGIIIFLIYKFKKNIFKKANFREK